MENRYLYIVFSSTPYTIGKLIRRFTGETYNHVSIALDPELKQMYSFARRHYRLPFYGGFVKECVSRFHVKGQTSQVRICRLNVSPEQFERVKQRLSEMYENKDHYLYNHLSVLTTPFRRSVHLKDAYTCVEFGVQILQQLGIPVDSTKYYSVGDLEALLLPYTIYTGPIPETDMYDAVFFTAKPVPHPVLTTLAAFFALFERLE